MPQPKITSFYNSRKRPASDDVSSSKAKLLHIDRSLEPSFITGQRAIAKSIDASHKQDNVSKSEIFHEPKKTIVANDVIPELKPSSEIQLEQKNSTAFNRKLNATNVAKSIETPQSSSIGSARKELSLGDIRKKLAGSSRLAELKATAERLSKDFVEVKEAWDKKNLKEFKSIDVEVPSSSSPTKKSLIQKGLLSPQKENSKSLQDQPLISPRKVFVSPIKSPSKVSAYIRHWSLATTSTSLPLPYRYRFLAEQFRGMETVMSLLHNRNEKVTFNKLKPSVQEMLKRNFTEKHLAQIKHLVPDFYNFEIQKVKNFSSSSQKESYELVITPNFPTGIKQMNSSVLVERRRYFYNALLQLVKKHHAQYLLTLDPPMVIPDDKLTRWHPEFELEKVSEVESAKLPEKPNVEKFSTAQDVLSKARKLFQCNTKMERALEKLVQAKARGLTQQEQDATGITDDQPNNSDAGTQTSQPSSGAVLINPALRNLPAALLEKVKAKQAAKALEAMTRSSQDQEKYLTYKCLPDLARTLRNIFVTERKNVLALNIILSKLESSFKSSVSPNALVKDIKVLAEEAPEWIKYHEIRNTTYLKLDKNAALKKIISKLEALAEKYKSN